MESMEAQIRSERGFIESQMSEREQEREDYEKKINELKQLLTKKSTDMFEAEDAVSNRVSNFYTNYPLFPKYWKKYPNFLPYLGKNTLNFF